MKYFFISILCLLTFLTASDQIPSAPQDHPVLLKNGVIHPVTSDPFTGDILFDEGIIKNMGINLNPSQETEIIELSGLHVYPGLISAGTTIGLVEINAVRATRDHAETGWLNPNVRVERAYNPDSEIIPVTRSNGILLAHVIPKGGTISGTSAVMKLDGWTWEDCVVKSQAGLHINWPNMRVPDSENNKKSREDRLKERNESLKRLDKILEDARAYHAAVAAGTQVGVDMRWEAMLPVISGEMPVFIHANRSLQIRAAAEWCVKNNLKMILMGGADSWKEWEILKNNNIPVIYEHPLSVPLRRDERTNMKYSVPMKLWQKGVKFCIIGSSGNFETPHQRNLPYEAAMASAYGLPRDEALKSVTLYPAEILGINEYVGSLETGKDATLIVTTGDPLEITSQVEMAFINGAPTDLSDRHKSLYHKYQAKYQQLKESNQD